MFKAIMSVLVGLLISHASLAQQNYYISVSGTISSLQVGEFDPFVLGDICLLEVKVSSGAYVGLVTDSESCEENRDELILNRGLVAVVYQDDLIIDEDQVSLLNSLSSAKLFYRVEFGGIENGLADLPSQVESEKTIMRRTVQADLLCRSYDGKFEAAVVRSIFASTGYHLYVVQNKSGNHKDLIIQETVSKPSIMKSANAELVIHENEATLKLNHQNILMSCKAHGVLEYDITLIFEPRVSVGN